jgi:hypothetical protein
MAKPCGLGKRELSLRALFISIRDIGAGAGQGIAIGQPFHQVAITAA